MYILILPSLLIFTSFSCFCLGTEVPRHSAENVGMYMYMYVHVHMYIHYTYVLP